MSRVPAAQISAELMQSETAQVFHDHVLVKEPGTSKPTPWHQDGPYYFVEVLALRNPIENPDGDSRKRGRGGGRDLEFFARLVDSMVGERARAEKKIHVKTSPFYLLP